MESSDEAAETGLKIAAETKIYPGGWPAVPIAPTIL